MSITVPFRSHRHDEADGPPALSSAPAEPAEDAHVRTAARDDGVRVGAVGLRSAAGYLLVWTGVLFVVEVLVFWGGHAALQRLGVLDSISEATATVFGDTVPESGVLPALEFSALLPWVLAVAGALAVLWLIASLSLLLIHNCICGITGGPRVRVR
jgi:hypothetical protein